MSASKFDHKYVKSQLLRIAGALSFSGGDRDKEDIQTFIRVGEYCLALDNLASVYLRNGPAAPADLLPVFEELSAKMKMAGDEEYQAVAKLLAAHPHSP